MFRKTLLAASGLAIVATAVFAGSHAGPFDGAITARKAQMQLNVHNISVLGGMAQGNIEYDAEAASNAAANLAALAKMSQAGYWPAGSDSSANDNTRALPALWENFPDVIAKSTALVDATAAMEIAAGDGLAALQGAMGALGGTCAACHKAYRQPQ